MILTQGTGQHVPFTHEAIKSEAGFDTGMTSIVQAKFDNDDEITISQHESGDWDISVNGEPHESHDDADDAVKSFIELVQHTNKDEEDS
jgi:hypothetical protein